MGHVNIHDQIWALPRHWGHVCQMLDSDWLIKILLRSDWLLLSLAILTTVGVSEISVAHTNCIF